MAASKDRIDPRILRTRKLIRDAFVDLLEEMELEKISVNRLAEKATINRVTFYLHYRDIPDMLEKMADEMIEEISSVLDDGDSGSGFDLETDRLRLLKFLEHVAEHPKFYRVALASKRIPVFMERLSRLMTERISEQIEKKEPQSITVLTGVQPDVTIWYLSAALIGTIISWLRNGMPYTPAYMAKQFSILLPGSKIR